MGNKNPTHVGMMFVGVREAQLAHGTLRVEFYADTEAVNDSDVGLQLYREQHDALIRLGESGKRSLEDVGGDGKSN